MHVRLAYSIAIQVEFDILLLDEVLAVGDQEFQERCFETLSAIRAAGQDDRVRLARSGCDQRALRPRDTAPGRAIQALGRPDDVLNRYGAIVHHVAEAVP